MPTAPAIKHQVNRAVGDPDTGSYRQAQTIVIEGIGLAEGIEAGGFFEGMSEAHQTEARAVLAALPADVDQAFMASLRRALDAGAKIEFLWEDSGDDSTFGHRSESGADGTIILVLVTPHGSKFTS
jgi:hypothetical protein